MKEGGTSGESYGVMEIEGGADDDCQEVFHHRDVPVGMLVVSYDNDPNGKLRNFAGSSTSIAMVNFFKGMFGSGVLVIPHAFESVGLPLGMIVFGVVACLVLCTMLMLLECQKMVRLRGRRTAEVGVGGMDEEEAKKNRFADTVGTKRVVIEPEVDTYEELAGEVFGPWCFHAVQIALAVLTLIVCSAFVIIISNSLSEVFPSVSRTMWCLIVFPVLVGLSFIPFIKDLWATSVFGLLVYLVGVIATTVGYSIADFKLAPGAYEFRWSGLPHFFGVAVYAMEGINLVLPISSSMRSRRKQPMVVSISTIGFAVLTFTYASLAYASGHGQCDIVVQCLGSGGLVIGVKIALSLSLLVTHPIYLIVASIIFERMILGQADHGNNRTTIASTNHDEVANQQGSKADTRSTSPSSPLELSAEDGQAAARILHTDSRPSRAGRTSSFENSKHDHHINADDQDISLRNSDKARSLKARLVRTTEVGITCAIAAAVPNLSKFTSLVGASLLTLIGFVLPAIMWATLVSKDGRYSTRKKLLVVVLAAVVVTLGLVAMLIGVKEGIKEYSS